MTIDEAIKHCLEVAEQQEADSFIDRWSDDDEWSESLKENCRQCAADHRQLAEWLTELKELSLQQNAPRLGSIEEYHFELARCKTAFWSCNKRCMDAEEQYRRKVEELKTAQEQISEYKRLLKAALADMNNGGCNSNCFKCKHCGACDYSERFTWKHTDEALKLIGGSENG